MLDFPNSPTNGQIFTTADGSWLWDTTKWKSGNGLGFLTTIGDTPPPAPQPGLLWWNSSPGIGQLYVYYNDGTSSQWVAANNMGAGGPFLPLTGGTLTGPLVIGNTIASPATRSLTINDTATVPASGATVTATLTIASETNNPLITLDTYSASAAPFYRLRAARGSAASPTAIQNGDGLGLVQWYSRAATAYAQAAAIACLATENWTAGANGCYLVFQTNAVGTNTPVNSLVLNGNSATFSGTVVAKGVTDGSVAAAGNVGEYLVSNVASPGTGIASNTWSNVTSLPLTAGDWDVSGVVQFNPSGSPGFAWIASGISRTSGGPVEPGAGSFTYGTINPGIQQLQAGVTTINVSAPQTVYLTANANYTGGSVAVSGVLRARRMH